MSRPRENTSALHLVRPLEHRSERNEWTASGVSAAKSAAHPMMCLLLPRKAVHFLKANQPNERCDAGSADDDAKSTLVLSLQNEEAHLASSSLKAASNSLIRARNGSSARSTAAHALEGGHAHN